MARSSRIDKSRLTIGLPAKPVRGPKEGDSPKHEAFIRNLPCIIDVAKGADPYSSRRCGEIHHLTGNQDGKGKGLGMQNRDRYGLPIKHANHRRVHPGPFATKDDGLTDEERLTRLGIDGRAAADFFWRHTGDQDACLAYMARHVMGAARKVKP